MTDQLQKRKRGPGRPVLENLRNAGPRLREGERSQLHRIRAPNDVHDWFASLTAEQRGEVLTAARSRLQAGLSAPAGKRRVAPEHLRPGYVPPASPEGPTLEGVTVLRVMSSTVPQRLRNKLRWAPERYANLEGKLSRTATLTLDRVNGKAIWRTSEGKPIRPETVSRLFEADVLTPADDQGERLPKPQPMGLAEAVRQAQRSRK